MFHVYGLNGGHWKTKHVTHDGGWIRFTPEPFSAGETATAKEVSIPTTSVGYILRKES